MEMFKPELALLWERDGTYTLAATTLTPHTGYSIGAARIGTPAGMVHVAEAIPVTLEIVQREGAYLPVTTAVTHAVPRLKLGDGSDRTAVVAYTVIDGKIVGVNGVGPHQIGANLPMGEAEWSPVVGFRDWHAVSHARREDGRLYLSGGVTMRGIGYRPTIRHDEAASSRATLVCTLEVAPPEHGRPLPGLYDVYVNFETGAFKDGLKEVEVRVPGNPTLHIPIQEIDVD